MNDESSHHQQHWYDSDEHFSTQLEARVAQKLGRAMLDVTGAQIRLEMAHARSAAQGERVKAIEAEVETLKGMVDALTPAATTPEVAPSPVKGRRP
ncbi:hypothetical protein [Phenylobacterium sp.]|jgi:hypothetical protein|uniref:hypothetical protein n=1 Tax=Phenylobacterium sp. TaxID=1871053 RepID=UPI0037C81844